MDNEKTPLSIRAYRVVGRRDGLYLKWLIIEDTITRHFRVTSYSGSAYPPLDDNDDTFGALNDLMNEGRILGQGWFHLVTADSISNAIEQQQIQSRDLQRRATEAMNSIPRAAEHTGTDGSPIEGIQIVRGPQLADAQLQQMIDEVWNVGAGIRLEWSPRGRTPEGYDCQVLMFDGSDQVLVHSTFLEIPKGLRRINRK